MPSTDIYAAAETMIRERLLARPQARARGKSPAFIEKAVKIGIWIVRKHGPYGARIFSACREVLRKIFGCCCRRALDALEQIGLLKFLPRANGHERKWRSPEFAAFQFELGPDFALLFPAAQPGPNLAIGQRQVRVSSRGLGFPVSGLLAPARTWDRKRPEMRLPSKAAIRRGLEAHLEALRAIPVPQLSALALRAWRQCP